ncbi:hypothetical protein LINPERHAP1_LOCUS30929 [Linum perenne]
MIYVNSSPLSCTVFSDCLSLINCLKGPKHRWPWPKCFRLLDNIDSILWSNPLIIFRFTPRSLSIKVDWVARSTRVGSLSTNWLARLCMQ